MIKLSLVLLLLLHYGLCGFFDFIEFEDPLTLLLHAKQSLTDKKKEGECTKGICVHPTYCKLTKGKIISDCGKFSTCCAYKSDETCSKTTSSLVSYFEGSGNNNAFCIYTVKIANPNICQIRLDFEEFDLAPAVYVKNMGFSCLDNGLSIIPNNYGIPKTLCGKNTGQHVYIHLDGADVAHLYLNLKDEDSHSTWKIKVSQLECPLTKINFSYKFHSELAPHAAIQYFTENNGHIRSFGYDSLLTDTGYTINENYAVAIRRNLTDCGIKYLFKDLNLDIPTLPPPCNDFISIPEENKVCGSNTNNKETTTYQPGTFYLYFHSQSFTSAMAPRRFYITYSKLRSCPNK